MAVISFSFLCLIATFCEQIYAGNFIGPVVVNYDVFTVIEGDSFSMECSARHEDRRPSLQWYFVDRHFRRRNLTSFKSSGRGNMATYTYYDGRAQLSDSGDYFCFAKVGESEEDQKTSAGVPIQVIEEDNRPRLMITKSRKRGKLVFTCKVYPQGNGFLTWFRDGHRIKYAKLVKELELMPTSGGDYRCHGNLTLGGYRHFVSTAYASDAVSWHNKTTQTAFISSILVCLITWLNL